MSAPPKCLNADLAVTFSMTSGNKEGMTSTETKCQRTQTSRCGHAIPLMHWAKLLGPSISLVSIYDASCLAVR